MAGVWLDVRSTLAQLDGLASDPWLLDEPEALRALQYELHAATEVLAGIDPPTDAGPLHDELVEALADARDATADIFEANAAGGIDAALPLVWEWRGALFRVRYAHLRLCGAPVPVPAERRGPTTPPARTPPSVTAAVVGLGSALVLAAALMGLWLLVALSLSATLAASLLLRP